jgi:secreted trypsin-like serine protease
LCITSIHHTKKENPMRKKVFVILIVLVLLAVIVVPVAAITNGTADGDVHPNVGLMVADVNGEPAWRCSGTLIHPQVFLTAGHCVYGASGARVWFDTDLSDNTEYPYGGLTSIEGTPIPQPQFNNFLEPNNPYDVGLVIFENPVMDIPLVTLPYVGFLDELKKAGFLRFRPTGAPFTVVGYGRTLESWPPPVTTSGKIRQVASSDYVALVPAQLHLSQHAVFDVGGTCFGDSGGPAFWVDDEGNEMLVAVTSTGDAQCVATGFYYRVDIPETLSFIEGVIDELE